jgi:hypothetical protein
MFGQLFRGELSVTATYWGGLVGFGVLMRVATFAISDWQMKQYLAGETFAPTAAVVSLLVVGAVWCAFLARAQYIAMHRNREPSGWAWFGFVLICINVLFYAYVAMQIINPSVRVGRLAIENEMRALNQTLPYEFEPGFTLSRASFEGGTMTYRYDVTNTSGGLSGNILMPDSEVEQICVDLEGYFKGPLEDVIYAYHFTNEVVERVVTKAECGY